MWLWHGTYDIFYKDIKKEGVIKPGINRDTHSIMLDNLINTVAKANLRGNCVYLSHDIDAMDGFDKSFRISTSNIDVSKLFVADNRALDHIIASYGTDAAVVHAYRYIMSYMSFNDFLKQRDTYLEMYYPEFLYFGEINIPTRSK